jgi:multidrug resistance efflux pump
LFVFLTILFLPWTQNVVGKGYVTTLNPEKRPQSIQSSIPGKIESWYVKEGDLVEKGDTILKVSEIKSDYFDPELVNRTKEQLEAKKKSVEAYQIKIRALDSQKIALKRELELKINQFKNKLQQVILYVQNDSIKREAAKTDNEIAKIRMERINALYRDGLKAKKDVEEKRLLMREAEAKFVAAGNSYSNSRNEVLISETEINRIKASYLEKISKVESDIATAQSNQFEAKAAVAKLKNTLMNYTKRAALQYILAPQKGYINKALKGGIGETFKEEDKIVSIMPYDYQIAVETYIRPIDIQLIQIGEKARIEFDGWPAIVFNGWPNASFGTYGAEVVAIENYISENNLYRVLLKPDSKDHVWPNKVRIGSGARTIALLNEVPVWYEIWRQLNGFPADYYKETLTSNDSTVEKN